MRYLLIALLFALVLPASAAPAAQWDPPCIATPAAHEDGRIPYAPYFLIIQGMQAGEGWSLSSTIPVSMTLTHVDSTRAITTTAGTLDRALYIITPDDLDARLDSAAPFTVYYCSPGVNPYHYAPLVRTS